MATTGPEQTEHPVLALAHGVEQGLASHADTALWSMDDEQTVELLRTAARLNAQLAELEARAVAHAETLGLPDQAGMRSTAAWLARTTTLTRGAAHQKVRLAGVGAAAEATRDALAHGRVHAEQAAVITGMLARLDDAHRDTDLVVGPDERRRAEAFLLDEARDHDAHALATLSQRLIEVIDPAGAEAHEARLLAAQEERARAKTSLRMRDDADGMTHGAFHVPVAQGSMLRKMLAALAAPKHVRATEGAGSYDWGTPTPAKLGKAFVELIERYPASKLPRLGGLSATAVAIGDFAILLGAVKAARLDTGVKISHTEFIRLATANGIIPAWMDTTAGRPRVLSLGRSQRFHSPDQRLALTVERTQCERDDCTVPAYLCHVHHDVPWSEGGTTDTETARLLCPFHHHQHHARGERPSGDGPKSYPLRT